MIDLNFKKIAKGCVAGILLTSQAIFAQTPTPDDQLRRIEERRSQLEDTIAGQRPQGRQTQSETGQKPQVYVKEGLCFPIEHISFVPSDQDADGPDFNWSLEAANISADNQYDPALGRCLGIQGINLAVTRIQNAIVESGFITTRVFLGPQDLKSGELKLTLVRGKLRDVRFADPNALVSAANTIPRRKDGMLFLRDIEQGLENLKRVPTAEADFEIVPSPGPDARAGDSDLVIAWEQKRPFRFNIGLDNAGSETTGKYQGSFTMSWDNPTSLSDLFYVTFDHDLGGGLDDARGTEGISAHYSVPYGYWAFALDVGSTEYFQTVAGANADIIYSGSSDTLTFKASNVLHRTDTRKLEWSLSLWARSSKNYIDGTEVQVQRRRTAGWELGFEGQDFIKRAVLNYGVSLRKGTGASNAIAVDEAIFGAGSNRPEILKFNVDLNSPVKIFGQEFAYSGSLKGQWASGSLISQDRFSIGSRYTVRGFTGERTLSGERGWTFRNDFSRQLGKSSHRAYLGLDIGSVSGPGTAGLAGTTLAGAALGLKGGFKSIKGLSYDVSVALPLKRPQGFDTGDPVINFNTNWAF